MSIVKHVGRHGDRKVAVVFRELPGESHMCLVVYTQTLNRHIHDAIIECVNSNAGQSSENLADALNRAYTRDGKLVLQQLHVEGMLKKVQTDQIIMTPTPSNKTDVKLSELNTLINKMNAGEEAARELEEMDRSRGLQDPIDVARRMRENKQSKTQQPTVQDATSKMYRVDDMSDAAIAWRLRQQATKMATEARGLLSESDRMLDEAAELDGGDAAIKPVTQKTKSKKTAVVAPLPVEPVIASPTIKTRTTKRSATQKISA